MVHAPLSRKGARLTRRLIDRPSLSESGSLVANEG